MSPKITIGMATYNDFEGVWATVQSALLHNDWETLDDVEIVIVDTSPPGSDHRHLVEDYAAKHGKRIKYVSRPDIVGTTEPRNLVFEHATAPFVVCMDCHVMLPPNALLRLSVWAANNPDCVDLIHGPILYDDLRTINTQFSDQFRGGMWGTWSTLWRAPNGVLFVTETEEVTDEDRERNSDGLVHYHDPFSMAPVDPNLPNMAWSGHQRELERLGCVELGRPNTDEAFPIPGMGMGLFASRRDSWLKFAANCSGFGGEEMNIHHKYRDAGRKAICLPFLKWNHRFGRSGGAPYPIPLAAKLRNYVLWANELKEKDTILARIHTHFVKTGNFPQSQWKRLINDPINFPVNLNPPSPARPLDQLYAETVSTPRDLDQHAETIRKLASKVRTVTAFVKRTEWEPFLAAGFPHLLTVYQSEVSPLTQRVHQAVQAQDAKDNRKIQEYSTHHENVDPLMVPTIEPTDLLVIDKVMSAEYVSAALARHGHSAKQYILLRGTQAFGEKAEGEPDKPGIHYAMKAWIEDNPEWYVLAHYPAQYGITILGCDPGSRPPQPVRPWPLGYGPGTQLKNMMASVGINPSPTCDCNTKMRQMDEWGIDGCNEHFDTIVGWLAENAEKWGWNKAAEAAAPDHETLSLQKKLSVGWKALMTGIAFKVDWTNPFPGLVREAINREVKRL